MTKEINLSEINQEKEDDAIKLKISKPIEDLNDAELRMVVKTILERVNGLSIALNTFSKDLHIVVDILSKPEQK